MMYDPPILGQDATGHNIVVDVPKLIESRLLITATSGQGKSWALRRMLEQTHGHVQHIVIDPEGEFYTLREIFDYVIARTGNETERDCPADLRSADLLARRLLELRVSAILDIFDMKAQDRPEFVRRFIESLMEAPRSLWHPVLVVIDEAQLFAPEDGKSVCGKAIIDLMGRGRKRGFTGCLASQRYSMVDKNALSMCRNVLIGGFTLDVDVDRAVKALGFTGRDAGQQLRKLAPGQFFVHGPALCREVTLVKVGKVTTTHPQAGQDAPAPAAPRATVRAVLAQLTDLPAEAEQKAKTEEELRTEVARLKREVSRLSHKGEIAEALLLVTEHEEEDMGKIAELEEQVRSLQNSIREKDGLIRQLQASETVSTTANGSKPATADIEDRDVDGIVAAILHRARSQPDLLRVLTKETHIEVDYEPVIVKADGTSFRGRVARLIHSGWFDSTRKNQEIADYLTQTGSRVIAGNLPRDLKWFVESEFLERDGGGYIASKTARRRVHTGAA